MTETQQRSQGPGKNLVFFQDKQLWETKSLSIFKVIAICFSLWIVSCQGDVLASNESSHPALNARHWGMYGGSVAKMDLDVTVKDIPIDPKGWAYPFFSDIKRKQNFWNSIHKYRQLGKYQLNILKTSGTFKERKAQLERMFNNEDGTTIYYKDLVGIALGHEIPTSMDKMENRLYDYIKSRWPDLQVYKFYSGPIKPYAALRNGNPEQCDAYLYDIYGGNRDGFRRTVQKFVITGKPVVILIWASEPGWSGYFKNDLVGEFSAKKQDEGMEMKVGAAQQDGLIKKAPNSDLEKYFRHASATLREFGLPVIVFGVAGSGSVNQWYWGKGSPNLKYIREKLVFPLRKEMRNSPVGSPKTSADYSKGVGIEVVGIGEKTSFDYGKQQSKFHKGMKEVPRRILPKPYVDNFLPDDVYVGLRTIDHATIKGFTHLALSNRPGGELETRDKTGQSGNVELVYRFFTKKGYLNDIKLSLTGSIDLAGKGVNSISLSKNGQTWKSSVKSTPGMSDMETLLLNGGKNYQNLKEFYVRIKMTYSSSLPGKPANILKKLTVSCVRNDPNAKPKPEVLYENDFGTKVQRTVGKGGDWDKQKVLCGGGKGSAIVPFKNGWNDYSVDQDGDGLHYGLMANSWYGIRWFKKIKAPAGFTMSNITLTVHGYGSKSHGARFECGISKNGVDFKNNGTAFSHKYYSSKPAIVSGGSGADYNGISEVWIFIQWVNGNHLSTKKPWTCAYIGNVKLEADLTAVSK